MVCAVHGVQYIDPLYISADGTIESACKHLIDARLKQVGMRWLIENARSLAKLRARFKSRRWAEPSLYVLCLLVLTPVLLFADNSCLHPFKNMCLTF